MNKPQITAGGDHAGVTLIQHSTEVHVYRITEDQLDRVSRGVDQLFWGAASTLFGIFVTLLATLVTMDKAESPMLTGAIVTAAGLIAVFFCLFVVLVLRDRRRHFSEIARIKNQGV